MSSPPAFVPGFEPLVVTESSDGGTEDSTERDTEGEDSSQVTTRSDSSPTPPCMTVRAPFTVTTSALREEGRGRHQLQKMPSFDFKKPKPSVGTPLMASPSGSLPRPPLTSDGLPPIPPDPAARHKSPVPTQNVRTQVGSSRLGSPSRAEPEGRKARKRVSRRYAASLPDSDRRHTSPIDLSALLAAAEGARGGDWEGPRSEAELARAKLTKSKYLWGRASLEREVLNSTKGSSPGPSSNRHSSYHPSIVDEAAAVAAAHVAYKFNQYFSRPSSPLFEAQQACHCCTCRHRCRSAGRARSGSRGSLLGLDYEDRLLRLESDKDSLHLQVSVLSDQIDAQTSKIHDLERLLDDKKNVLESTEDTLQRELLTRSSLETQKLELMTEISSLRLKHASLERENFDLKDRWGGGRSRGELNYGGDSKLWDKPPPGMRSPSPSPSNHQQNGFVENGGHRSRVGSNGSEVNAQVRPTRPRTPPANAYRRVEASAFGTLPRRNPSQLSAFNNGVPVEVGNGKGSSFSSGNLHGVHGSQHQHILLPLHLRPFAEQHYAQSGEVGQTGVGGAYSGPGGGLFYTSDASGPRSTSAPNLAAIEREEWERRNNIANSKGKLGSNAGGHKSRGILRILSKLKRSNSGGLDNDVAPESLAPFARGGFRSTAAPRLGWIQDPNRKPPEGPPSSWDSASVIHWLCYLGLGMYSPEVKRWVKSGQQLLDASTKELEKELGIKNSLHRKKLKLALHHLKHPEEDDSAGKLDYQWVIRWLDDVGLPQYKETFGEARVDGRILSTMTQDDLIFLKVTSQLHHTSIKRGIQLLRIHKFHPGCLCRRGGGGSSLGTGIIHGETGRGPSHVATWTNHRVMEWLRAIDLAEYAPNLRGSGVHGALVVFEPKFNAELLATLLSIPGNKTLLRRHLSLQLNELVGRQIVQEKRLTELAADFLPISPTVKVKHSKPAKVFNLRKKRHSSEVHVDDLLCPLDWNDYPFGSESTGNGGENSGDGPKSGDKVSNI